MLRGPAPNFKGKALASSTKSREEAAWLKTDIRGRRVPPQHVRTWQDMLLLAILECDPVALADALGDARRASSHSCRPLRAGEAHHLARRVCGLVVALDTCALVDDISANGERGREARACLARNRAVGACIFTDWA